MLRTFVKGKRKTPVAASFLSGKKFTVNSKIDIVKYKKYDIIKCILFLTAREVRQ